MDDLNFGEQLWDYKDVKGLLEEFLELYGKRPIKDNRGGMLSVHLFWTWYVLKKLNPKTIIESGIYKGQGTWLMRQVCPEAKIYSIDPCLSRRVYIDEQVTYLSKDFNIQDWNDIDREEAFCFFDDHQNAYLRLQEMKWMGFKRAMFEDNYPVSQGDCYSCKKILSECGCVVDGKEKVEANSAHAKYFRNNIKTYTTLPPLFKNEVTRWGDDWNDEDYPTSAPILSDSDLEKYPVFKQDAGSYTWICYLELK